jgi:predicted NUDIX family phosphoesterase
MIGGHVDEADRQFNDPTLSCLNRELEEEIGITPKPPPQLAGLAVDPENSVGRLHIGFVFDVQVDSPIIQIKSKFDNAEFTNASRTKYYEFMNEKTIMGLMGKFDPWSYLFLSSDYPVARYNWSSISKQPDELPLAW